jgi:regulator of replication initiation timing
MRVGTLIFTDLRSSGQRRSAGISVTQIEFSSFSVEKRHSFVVGYFVIRHSGKEGQMRFWCCCSLAMILLSGAAGCDLAKSKELAARIEHLEAENQRLSTENARLSAENEKVQKALTAAENELAEWESRQEQLKSAALGQLQQLIQQYGAGISTAKELGLPELKDLDFENLLRAATSTETEQKDE